MAEKEVKPETGVEVLAKQQKEFFDAYIKAGFTEAQAIEFVKHFLTSSINMISVLSAKK